MAALLKKRALAEFSQVLQEEPPKPPKRLRISKKLSFHETVDVEQLKNISGTEALNLLIHLSELLPTEQEDIQCVYKTILEHFHAEKEPASRAKIISIFRQMVENSLLVPINVFEDAVALLKAEKSHKVLVQIIELFNAIGKATPDDNKLHHRLLQQAKQCLFDENHLVRCKCLEVIGEYTPIDSLSESGTSTLRILGENIHDQDPRVRSSALLTLIHLHERGLKLDLHLYEESSKALSDDYEGVRIEALKLVQVLSHLYADHMVAVEGGEEKIRLADDAFAKICNTVNDLSMNVRVEATSLLGKMNQVSLSFLEQTLDKKLMSNLRRKRTAHERQKESYESGEWATGQKWADDAPKEVIDAESVSLITSGACGAFVHGLEDEFLEVRSATLDSLCQLALQFPTFALLSLDFLVDMFNDEIEEVRLKAIQCLGRISHFITLREDQLDTILAVLEDFSMDIREALHEMLANCKLSTKAGLKLCIDNLLENLKRYPQDKMSIWRCLQKLGTKHPYITLPLVPELLGIHPYFDMPEPDMDDPSYVSILILVFNAAASCPTMMALFEEHTLRHFSYLRDILPNLVPQLRIPNQSTPAPQPTSSSPHSRTFLHQVLERVSAAEHRNPSARQSLLEISIRDLQRLSEIEPTLSAAANCANLYIQCQLLLSKILSNKNWLNPSVLSPLQTSTLKSALEQLLHHSFCLCHQFIGLRPEEMACLRQLRVRALALHFVVVIRSTNSSTLALCEAFLDQVDALQRYLEEHDIQPDSFTMSMFRELDALEEPKPGSVARVLQPLLQAHPCPSLKLHIATSTTEETDPSENLERVKQAKAVIHEPTGESDNPLKFTAGLVQGILLDAQIENVVDIKNVRVKVRYPDQQTPLILPRLADFRQQSPLLYRLYTTILLSHNVWSEACHVEISLVLDFTDTEGNTVTKTSQKTLLGLKNEDHQHIELCKPVKVYIAPKPVKKGI